MNIVCIIPARGGSKGIPLKNIQLVAGKPLIAYNIEAALKSRFRPRVFVSTDSQKIADVAQTFGAQVVMQPAEVSQDTSMSEKALLFALSEIAKKDGETPDLLVFLQCTSPLTATEDIDGTVQALLSEKADTALSVTQFHYFLWHKDQNGDAVGINHSKEVRLRRQDREPQYLETGAIYVMKVPEFLKRGHRFFGKTAFHVMPHDRVLEIDEPMDLQIAEAIIGKRAKL